MSSKNRMEISFTKKHSKKNLKYFNEIWQEMSPLHDFKCLNLSTFRFIDFMVNQILHIKTLKYIIFYFCELTKDPMISKQNHLSKTHLWILTWKSEKIKMKWKKWEKHINLKLFMDRVVGKKLKNELKNYLRLTNWPIKTE